MSHQNNANPDKGKIFKQLHHNGNLVVLPNVWDPLSAMLLESLGYPAVATASASIALSNGYRDGEKIPFEEVLVILKKIVNSVNIPVSADIESGYAKNKAELEENMKKLIDTGIVGINFEDSSHPENKLIATKDQCEKISIIKKVGMEKGSPLFINARSDVYLRWGNLSEEEKLLKTIERGKAYKDAGADGFYPIIVREKQSIESIVKEVGLPVNIILLPGTHDFETLKNMGVSRLSLGPGFLKTAINAMKNIAGKLLAYEGINEITNNPVSSDYLNDLISKKYIK
ncbi:MAG: isocitrate lyase/phosphoenolpyruvate mutase family protein [Ginsengibacter sp.]